MNSNAVPIPSKMSARRDAFFGHARFAVLRWRALAAITILFSAEAWAQQEPMNAIELLNRFNVITGDYNVGGETEGSVFVAGEFNPSGTHQFGFNGGVQPSDTAYTLWLNNGVAATAAGPTQVQSGSVLSRAAVDPGDFLLNGNAPDDPVITDGPVPWNQTLSAQLGHDSAASIMSTLSDTSAYWASLAANSTATIANGAATFTATPVDINGTQVAIFNVGSAALDGTVASFDLILNGAEAVLVNVSGTDIEVNKNFIGQFNGNESRVLFNFYEAEDLTLNNNFRGTIFAPGATVTQAGSNIDGNVVASTFNQNAEVHVYGFDGNLPVPEPSSLFLAALAAATLLRRQRPCRA